jgi:anhydro-N-acetylmuramic acid kinase
MQAIGLMSGTSLDGVDVALVVTDGETIFQLGALGYRAYRPDEREVLRAALAEGRGLADRASRPGVLDKAEALVTRAHAEAVEAFLAAHGIARETIDVVGFHGQTVLHRPEARLTVQLGDGPRLAKALAIPVVYDFRAADVAAGGEGAPFVPVVHRALARRSRLPTPLVVVNIGGVANITFVGRGDLLIAFDTGPGNALLDDFVLRRTGAPFDRDGALARAGRAHPDVLRELMRNAYFVRPAPKSLDRDAFSAALVEGLAIEDAAATLVAFTVETIAIGVGMLPERPVLVVAAGGGARNPQIVHGLQERLGIPVQTADEIGWSADGLEAQAFAVLAVRSLRGLPLSFPGTTGVPEPIAGGVLAEP